MRRDDRDADKVRRVVDGQYLSKEERLPVKRSQELLPENVGMSRFRASIRRRQAEAATRFTRAVEDFFGAKVDYYRARDRAEDIDKILDVDRAQRDAALYAAQHEREFNKRRLDHAAAIHEAQMENEREEARYEAQKLRNRNAPLSERLKRKYDERLVEDEHERRYQYESHRRQRSHYAELGEARDAEIYDYVGKVKKKFGRAVDPEDRSTWEAIDEQVIQEIIDHYADLRDRDR